MTPEDVPILRELAQQISEIAARPEMESRRQEWYRHNALQPGKPIVYCSPEGAWEELLPDATLRCVDEQARGWEQDLRTRLYIWEHFSDDEVIDDSLTVAACLNSTWWTTDPVFHRTTARGTYVWESSLQNPADLHQLRQPETTLNEAGTQLRLEQAHEVFDGLLRVKLNTWPAWPGASLGQMEELAFLRGMEQILFDMVERPEFVHEAMSFLLAGRQRWLDSMEQQGLLQLNNGNTYIGSGGFGFTHELPAAGYETGHGRCRDLWGFSANQETSTISPRMFEEFVLNYQLPLLERFGLNCYACCEPIHDRLDAILRIPHLRRLSISPWTDREISAEKLGAQVIYSWKPNPARLAGIRFDEELVRREIRETLQIAQGCIVEIILKDTHTCNHDPARFDRWCQIAQEETQRHPA
jgi:hypothetical protein